MNRFERLSIWITTAVTTLTGVALLWTKYLIRSDDPWAVINHPLQPWVLKAHIVAAPLLIFALGLITSRHVWTHFRSRLRWGRKTGLVTAAVTAPMVLSGYLIQVVTQVGWLRAMVIVHIVTGFVFALFVVFHQVAARSRVGSRNGASEPDRLRRGAPAPVMRRAAARGGQTLGIAGILASQRELEPPENFSQV